MKATELRSGLTEGVRVLIAEEGECFSYDINERWNGEYYKGWKSDEYGEAIDEDVYKIIPMYIGVGEQDEDGDFEVYEIEHFQVEKL